VQALERAGITVVDRLPCEVGPTETRRRYLRTKKDKLGHLLTNVWPDPSF
jgi:3,4-dihydroxy 2-butanone 4-phosphate synthase/GTP cyclohydrolase II